MQLAALLLQAPLIMSRPALATPTLRCRLRQGSPPPQTLGLIRPQEPGSPVPPGCGSGFPVRPRGSEGERSAGRGPAGRHNTWHYQSVVSSSQHSAPSTPSFQPFTLLSCCSLNSLATQSLRKGSDTRASQPQPQRSRVCTVALGHTGREAHSPCTWTAGHPCTRCASGARVEQTRG